MNWSDRLAAAFGPVLPPSYECRAALERITAGLVGSGVGQARAEWAAGEALLEAPFVAPDEAGWRWVCNRARQIAREAA